MKDITLKIIGKQKYRDIEEDQMEFITDGKLYFRNDDVYIVYDESAVSGMEGCTTTIRLREQSVRMKRIGDGGFQTELYFETGKRFSSFYETPYGMTGVEVLTEYVKNHFNTETCQGTIDVKYHVSMEGIAEGCNQLTIKIM